MSNPHALNPINVSEGGTSLRSEWGDVFDQHIGENIYNDHQTILPHQNLLFPYVFGSFYLNTPLNAPLPYTSYRYGGPLSIEETQGG